MGRHRVDPLVRFLSHVDRRGDCWLWTGSHYGNGYGQSWMDGKPMSAHRLSWLLHFGVIPSGQNVLHRCDNPLCVNPAHLFLGTQAANMADKVNKGRAGVPYGESHARAKLTAGEAAEILQLVKDGNLTQREIAQRYGVSQPAVHNILHGVTWGRAISESEREIHGINSGTSR